MSVVSISGKRNKWVSSVLIYYQSDQFFRIYFLNNLITHLNTRARLMLFVLPLSLSLLNYYYSIMSLIKNHSLVDFILSNSVFLVYLIDLRRVLSSSLSLDRSLRFLWFFTVGSLGPFCMLFLLLFPYLSEGEGTWRSYNWWAAGRAQPVSIYSPSYSAETTGSEPYTPHCWAWAWSRSGCPMAQPWFYYQQTLSIILENTSNETLVVFQ